MAWRQLPDGSFFDSNTGDLKGLDGNREAKARAISAQQGNPFPPLPQQRMITLPGAIGPQQIIAPSGNLLAVNPFELGLGTMTETTKRVLMVGAFVGIAAVTCWITNKTAKKSKKR